MSDIERRLAGLSPAKQALLRARTERRERESRQGRTIPQRNGRDELPLSFSQERIWLHGQIVPGSVVYNRPANIRLRGPLQAEPLCRALREVVARHESLRTSVALADGTPALRRHSHVSLDMPFIDLSGAPVPNWRARQMAQEEAYRPFDLEQGPLLRSCLLRIDCEDHLLLLTFHHFTFDAWSQAVLLEELTRYYEAYTTGVKPPVEVPAIQYADFAAWDRCERRVADLEAGRAYWRRELADPPVLQLPTDFPRPTEPSEEAGHVDIVLPAELVTRLRELASCEQTTLFSVLLTAFTALLHRYTGDEDIVVGCPVAGRNRVETEELIGVFINTLPFRANLAAADTCRQLLQRVRECVLRGLQHQEVPLQFVVQDVLTDRDISGSPLFQAMFIHERLPLQPRAAGSVMFEPEDTSPAVTMVDLSLELMETSTRVGGHFAYRRDLWERATIERMVGHFVTLLEGIAADPDRRLSHLPLLTEAERSRILVDWSSGDVVDLPHATIHECVSKQAKAVPDALAVVCADSQHQMAYRELETRATHLASRLREFGIRNESRVGLLAERSGESLCAMLAVLKAGAAFVPLDPRAPPARLSRILADCQPEVVLAQQRFAPLCLNCECPIVLLDDHDAEFAHETWPALRGSAANAAYVIYTSGSTGTPNGVVIEHRSLVNFCRAACRQYGITGRDRVLQFAPLTFDACIEEIFPAWMSGGTIILRSQRAADSAHHFFNECREHGVTFVSLPTAFWHVLCEELASGELSVPNSLRLITIGGEAADVVSIANWRKHVGDQVRLLNTYGPTEATVIATACDLTVDNETAPSAAAPIGRPIANTQVYVLDERRQPVPIGIPGELYIGGAGLARGYLNRPELTAERFVANPFDHDPNSRLYHTGDRCRWRADGDLEFLGRLDDQVKLRGFRIELGEIASVLNEHPDVAQSVVVLREDRPGAKRLVAYCVSAAETALNFSALRSHLRNRLPDYMVPAAFVGLDRFPLTSSGKVNRRTLPAPGDSRSELEIGYVAPRNSSEQQLASIWCDVLRIETIGIHDNFFALGGDSLMATRIVARALALLQVDLPLRKLFETPTIAELSTEIETLRSGD